MALLAFRGHRHRVARTQPEGTRAASALADYPITMLLPTPNCIPRSSGRREGLSVERRRRK